MRASREAHYAQAGYGDVRSSFFTAGLVHQDVWRTRQQQGEVAVTGGLGGVRSRCQSPKRRMVWVISGLRVAASSGSMVQHCALSWFEHGGDVQRGGIGAAVGDQLVALDAFFWYTGSLVARTPPSAPKPSQLA